MQYGVNNRTFAPNYWNQPPQYDTADVICNKSVVVRHNIGTYNSTSHFFYCLHKEGRSI